MQDTGPSSGSDRAERCGSDNSEELVTHALTTTSAPAFNEFQKDTIVSYVFAQTTEGLEDGEILLSSKDVNTHQSYFKEDEWAKINENDCKLVQQVLHSLGQVVSMGRIPYILEAVNIKRQRKAEQDARAKRHKPGPAKKETAKQRKARKLDLRRRGRILHKHISRQSLLAKTPRTQARDPLVFLNLYEWLPAESKIRLFHDFYWMDSRGNVERRNRAAVILDHANARPDTRAEIENGSKFTRSHHIIDVTHSKWVRFLAKIFPHQTVKYFKHLQSSIIGYHRILLVALHHNDHLNTHSMFRDVAVTPKGYNELCNALQGSRDAARPFQIFALVRASDKNTRDMISRIENHWHDQSMS